MKNIIKRKVGIRPNNNTFRNKIIILTLVFSLLFSIIAIFTKTGYFADVVNYSRSILGKEVLLSKLDQITETNAERPLKQITNWSEITNYEETKWKNWNELSSEYKTSFPLGKLSEIVSKYQRINLYNMYDYISNPSEIKLLTMYRRLIGAIWTAEYCQNKDNCNSWVLDSGDHAGIDFISSLNTPVYASMNGIVLKSCSSNCDSFGNQIVIATDFNGDLIATFYAHLNGLKSGLYEGDIIKKGDLIGYMGNSGNATVPHLHFQINKLGKTSEIKDTNIAKKLYNGWYENKQGVKDYTINPLNFIETNKIQQGDNFNNYPTPLDEGINISSSNNNESGDFIDQIVKQVDTTNQESSTSSEIVLNKPASSPFKIVSIKSSKIDNKLTKGDTIKLTINTKGSDGAISINTDNSVLSVGQYIISPQGDDSYTVLLTANTIGNGQVIFNDGYEKKSMFFSVYDTDLNVYGLQINGANIIYKSQETEYLLYPVDKLGNRVYTNLQGVFTFDIVDKNSKQSYKITQFYNDSKESNIIFKIKSPGLEDYKLKVSYEDNNKSLLATKNLKSDIFFDYSINDKYGKNISKLLALDIVKGHEGLLMPYNKITRAEIITLMVRNKYGDNFDLFNKEMKEYISKNGKFFKDINGDEWFAPYLYIGFKNKILEGTNKKALPYDYVNKAELITLLGRTYNIQYNDLFISWLDVGKTDRFKPYVDACKKYNLYPFVDFDYFKPYELVNRLDSFESLYRYITLNPNTISFSVNTTQDQKIEAIMNSIIKF